jgi:predicted dehydrogenase
VTLRFGVLGAARITPNALLEPAGRDPEVRVLAVAARSEDTARAFAFRHGIPRVHPTYDALLADPDVDAVYNPSPNGLHGHWTLAALRAGKHVLCEKPFAANADEATAVAEAAAGTGLVVMEAFHYRYHSLSRRLLEVLGSGALGEVVRIEAWFHADLPGPDPLRWSYGLAGGATMDVGCYALHLVRTLAGAEPVVTSATAEESAPGVDRTMSAELAFAAGRTGSMSCSLLSRHPRAGARVVGTAGELEVSNPYAPHVSHELRVRTSTESWIETVPLLPTTYTAQLHAFAGAVLRGEPVATGPEDAVATMRAIDACYLAAGLLRREPTRLW